MSNQDNTLAEGLRALADWVDVNPDVASRINVHINEYVSEREDIVKAARALGKAEKVGEGPYFTVRGTFGPVTLDFFTNREKVCRRIVTGTVERAERVIPAGVEEIVDWVCDEPLLGAA